LGVIVRRGGSGDGAGRSRRRVGKDRADVRKSRRARRGQDRSKKRQAGGAEASKHGGFNRRIKARHTISRRERRRLTRRIRRRKGGAFAAPGDVELAAASDR